MRLTYMLCLLAASCSSMPPASPAADRIPNPGDPDAVRLVVEDVRRLASVLRSMDELTDSAEALQEDYLDAGTPALRTYAGRHRVTPSSILGAIQRHGITPTRLDVLADSILARELVLRIAFRRLAELDATATFPPVWFVVGHMGAGGMNSGVGPIIAAERYLDEPQDVVPIVLHELAHVQQVRIQGLATYRRIYNEEEGSLLALALREGSAELIAALTAGRHINPAAEEYGLAHEAELWRQFSADMHSRDTGDWLFRQPADPERPQDLGYWVGYRIALSYYERAADKAAAIADILAMSDFEAFLDASGYADRFTGEASANLERHPAERATTRTPFTTSRAPW